MALIPKIAPIQGPWPLPYTKSTAWIFPLYFQLHYLPTSLAKHCLDFPLYFQLHYLRTSLAKHFLDFSFAFAAPLPAYRPWAQISNHERACTQALLLYKKRPLTHCTVSTSQFPCVGDRSQRLILKSNPVFHPVFGPPFTPPIPSFSGICKVRKFF